METVGEKETESERLFFSFLFFFALLTLRKEAK